MSYISRFVRSFGRGGLLTALVIAATLLSVSIAQASPKQWDCYNLNSSFNWSDATGNWAQNGVQISSYPVSGTGTICINNGATVTMDVSCSYQAFIVGGYSNYSYHTLGGAGTFNLATSGVALTLSSTMSVGAFGYGGTVTQSPGTTITGGGDLRMGGNGSGSPSITAYYHQIGGSASFMNAYFGSAGSNYGKYVQDGGLLTISAGLSGMEFGDSSASAAGGEYHLNGGTLDVAVSSLWYAGYGASSFEFAGGTLQAGANFVSSGFNASNPMSLKSATNSTVDPNGHTIQFQNGLTGNGAITLGGTNGGTVQFSGNNSYTGATTVVGGTLYVTAGSISTSSDIQVATGATYQVLVSPSTSVSLYSRLTSGDSNALQLTGSVLATDSTLNSTNIAMQWRRAPLPRSASVWQATS